MIFLESKYIKQLPINPKVNIDIHIGGLIAQPHLVKANIYPLNPMHAGIKLNPNEHKINFNFFIQSFPFN